MKKQFNNLFLTLLFTLCLVSCGNMLGKAPKKVVFDTIKTEAYVDGAFISWEPSEGASYYNLAIDDPKVTAIVCEKPEAFISIDNPKWDKNGFWVYITPVNATGEGDYIDYFINPQKSKWEERLTSSVEKVDGSAVTIKFSELPVKKG